MTWADAFAWAALLVLLEVLIVGFAGPLGGYVIVVLLTVFLTVVLRFLTTPEDE